MKIRGLLFERWFPTKAPQFKAKDIQGGLVLNDPIQDMDWILVAKELAEAGFYDAACWVLRKRV